MKIRHLGRRPCAAVLAEMQAYTEARGPHTPDELWLVEHDPVYTQGLAGRSQHVLAAGTIPVLPTNRGGQVTYHGPGQIVVYPLLDLRVYGLKVREYVHLLEQVLIDTLATLGLQQACRKPGAPGVYLPWDGAPGGLAKIAALGIKVTRSCSWHGLALNVDMDLTPFNGINPCGYEGLLTIDLRTAGVKMETKAVADLLIGQLLDALQKAQSATQIP